MLGPTGSTIGAVVTTNPTLLATIPSGTSVTAGTGVFTGITTPSNGIVSIFGVITGTATYLTFTVDGVNYFGLFTATNMTVNAWYCATIAVAKGDNINVSAAVNTTAGAIRVLFTPSS